MEKTDWGRRWTVRTTLLAVAASLMAGCGGDEPTTDGPAREEGPDAPPRFGEPARIEGGDTILSVEPERFLEDVKASRYDPIAPGNRFVGVILRIRNEGRNPYSDSPSNGARLITAQDKQTSSVFLTGGPCDDSFGTNLVLEPDDERRGCIPFEVARGQSFDRFQWISDSGYGESASWELP